MTSSVVPASGTPLGDQARRRLAEEKLIWLTTVGKDGTPQPNPVWFLWDGADGVLTYNAATANRLVHVRARPRVSLHFNSDDHGGSVLVLTGAATLPGSAVPALDAHDAYLAKYADAAARVSGSVAQFARDYPTPLHITLTHLRGF
jgi:PPOX class probable F420-dependent enzyme